MVNIILLNDILLNVVVQKISVLNFILLNGILLNVTLLNVIIKSVFLSVTQQAVIPHNVMVPHKILEGRGNLQVTEWLKNSDEIFSKIFSKKLNFFNVSYYWLCSFESQLMISILTKKGCLKCSLSQMQKFLKSHLNTPLQPMQNI